MTDNIPDPQSPSKIAELARDMVGRHVISAGMVYSENPSLVPQVFIPLGLGGLDHWTAEEIENVVIFAVDGKDKSSGYLNGWPMFFEMRVWTRDDFTKAMDLAKEAEELLRSSDGQDN